MAALPGLSLRAAARSLRQQVPGPRSDGRLGRSRQARQSARRDLQRGTPPLRTDAPPTAGPEAGESVGHRCSDPTWHSGLEAQGIPNGRRSRCRTAPPGSAPQSGVQEERPQTERDWEAPPVCHPPGRLPGTLRKRKIEARGRNPWVVAREGPSHITGEGQGSGDQAAGRD